MYKIYLPLTLFLFAADLAAQADFQLFRPGVPYLYENPEYDPDRSSSLVTQLYGVLTGSSGCDSLYSSLEQTDPLDPTCVRIVPSPFGTVLCQREDSTVAYFSATDSLVLYPEAELGRRWLARDSSGTLTFAEVTDIAAATGDAEDRLKTITFYPASGEAYPVPLIVSEKYGVVSSPRLYRVQQQAAPLTLAGRGGEAPTGLQLPPPADYDSVSVGDVYHFEYVRTETPCNGCDPRYVFEQFAGEVTSVVPEDDAVRFTTRGDLLIYRLPLSGGPARDSVIIRDTTREATVTALPAALRGRQPGEIVEASATGDSIYAILTARDLDCGLITLGFSTPVDFTDDPDCGFDTEGLDATPGPYYTAYFPFPLGSLVGVGGSDTYRFVYLETEGKQCGTPYDFADITIGLSPLDLSLDPQFLVYPNPSHAGLVRVVLPQEPGEFDLSVYSAVGQEVARLTELRERAELDISSLSRGTYLVVLRRGAQVVARRKLVVR